MSHIISRPIIKLRKPMPVWRKKVGLRITHVLARVIHDRRMAFHNGAVIRGKV